MSIISVKNLHKEFKIPKHKRGFWKKFFSLVSREYDIKVAIKGISFNIKEGELVGYIGPNGAGKSTTIKILSAILVPDGGEVLVMGKTPWKERVSIVQKIGVVFGQRTQLWWDLPVIESFELLKNIYKISDYSYKSSLDRLTMMLNLEKLLSVPVRQLSLGQRMRCDIAAALLHSPKILFLDEPTIGLDAVSKLAVRDFIRHLNREQQITIILTTHDMDDIESLCYRVLILNEGQIFLDGSLENVRNKISPERYLIVDLVNEKENIIDEQALVIKKEDHRVWLSFDPSKITASDLISRITAKYSIKDLFVENPSIEEIIAKFYKNL